MGISVRVSSPAAITYSVTALKAQYLLIRRLQRHAVRNRALDPATRLDTFLTLNTEADAVQHKASMLGTTFTKKQWIHPCH